MVAGRKGVCRPRNFRKIAIEEMPSNSAKKEVFKNFIFRFAPRGLVCLWPALPLSCTWPCGTWTLPADACKCRVHAPLEDPAGSTPSSRDGSYASEDPAICGQTFPTERPRSGLGPVVVRRLDAAARSRRVGLTLHGSGAWDELHVYAKRTRERGGRGVSLRCQALAALSKAARRGCQPGHLLVRCIVWTK